MPLTYRTEILIIGAGPAGLSAALGCIANKQDFLLIELGSRVSDRDHTKHQELGTGVGGSGLYSDGKFSFFPSASALWGITNLPAIGESWQWFSDLVSRFGLTPPTLPPLNGHLVTNQNMVIGADGIKRKDYDSIYMTLADRKQLIEFLEGQCGTRLLPNVDLKRVHYDKEARLFECDIQAINAVSLDMIKANAVIFAGGRFGSFGWSTIFPQMPQVFKRVEVGVRLEQDVGTFFLQNDRFLDPKLIPISSDGRYSWRTFCCCRNGEIVTTKVRGIVSVSGRADGVVTGKSNIGFNLRVTDPALSDSLWPNDSWLKEGNQQVDSQLLRKFLEDPASSPIAKVIGSDATTLLAKGLLELCSSYRYLLDTPCQVVAPAIEGIGCYPELSNTLRSGDYPLWVAGDATGMFRGLTAAMISGYFVALQTAAYMEASQ